MDLTWKIAIGVCVGILLAAFSYEAIQAARLRLALEEAKRQASAELLAQQRAQRQAQATAELQRARQAQASASLAAAQQRAVEMAKLAQAEAREAKEEAWKRFYQPNPACKANWTVDCANSYIAAKRAFEARYAQQR